MSKTSCCDFLLNTPCLPRGLIATFVLELHSGYVPLEVSNCTTSDTQKHAE
jgi:hypothetical protein